MKNLTFKPEVKKIKIEVKKEEVKEEAKS